MQNIAQIYGLSKRNVILRYKSSFIGFFWGFLKPLLYLMIFIVIFSAQFSSVSNYVLYATSGLIFWFFFANVTNQSVASVVSSAGIIKALNIPIILFPLSEMMGELFNFLLTLVVFFVIMHWFGITYSLKFLLILPCLFLFSVFTFGLMLILSSLNVFFRDVGIMWGTVQPALFYLTPIAYPERLIAGRYSFVMRYNPIYHFIKLGRRIIYDPVAPPIQWWLHCGVLALAMLLVGLVIFNKLKNQFISTI